MDNGKIDTALIIMSIAPVQHVLQSTAPSPLDRLLPVPGYTDAAASTRSLTGGSGSGATASILVTGGEQLQLT